MSIKILESFRLGYITLIPIPGCPEVTISKDSDKNFWTPVIIREEERGMVDPDISDEIWYLFKGKTIPATEAFISHVFSLKQDSLIHDEILTEAGEKDIKRIYNYSQAKSIVKEAILCGKVDETDKGITAYFKIDAEETLYRFGAWRGDWGDKKNELCIYVYKVNLLQVAGMNLTIYF